MFGQTKLTLRRIKRIRWKQVVSTYQRLYNNDRPGGMLMKYSIKKYFSSLGMFINNDEFKELKYWKVKGLEKEVLTQTEWERLLPILPKHYRLPFEVMYGSGLRVMELLKMKKKDITFTGSTKGKIQVIGKGGKARFTTLTHDLTDKIKQYAKGMGSDQVLFTARNGFPYTTGR